MSTPNDQDKPREPEQGVRRGTRKAPDETSQYRQGVGEGEALLRRLEGSIATSQALHQSLNTVLLRGQPDELRGFCDTLQAEVERLQGRDDAEC